MKIIAQVLRRYNKPATDETRHYSRTAGGADLVKEVAPGVGVTAGGAIFYDWGCRCEPITVIVAVMATALRNDFSIDVNDWLATTTLMRCAKPWRRRLPIKT